MEISGICDRDKTTHLQSTNTDTTYTTTSPLPSPRYRWLTPYNRQPYTRFTTSTFYTRWIKSYTTANSMTTVLHNYPSTSTATTYHYWWWPTTLTTRTTLGTRRSTPTDWYTRTYSTTISPTTSSTPLPSWWTTHFPRWWTTYSQSTTWKTTASTATRINTWPPSTYWPITTSPYFWPTITRTTTWQTTTRTPPSSTTPSHTWSTTTQSTSWPTITPPYTWPTTTQTTPWPKTTIPYTWPTTTRTTPSSTTPSHTWSTTTQSTSWPTITPPYTWPTTTQTTPWPKTTIPYTWPTTTRTTPWPTTTLPYIWPTTSRTTTWPTTPTPKTPWPTSTTLLSRTAIVYEQFITVNCQESNWYIRLYIGELQRMFPDFDMRDVYLGSDGCTGYQSGSYIIFNEDYNSCKTNKSTNNNIVIYTNTLVYALHDRYHRFIVREYRFKVKVECDMSKRESGIDNIQHNHGKYEDHTASGSGHFTIHLKFYSDSNYQNEFSGFPPSYMIGDNVYVKVQTNIHDYDLKMRVSECYTKPFEHSSDAFIYYLIKNGCPDDPNAFITSQSTHETRFYFQDFEYAGHPDSMFVHCNATFCRTDDYSSECEPHCGGKKRARITNQSHTSSKVDFDDDGMTIKFDLSKGNIVGGLHGVYPADHNSASTAYVTGIVVVSVGFVLVIFAAIMIVMKRKWKNVKSDTGRKGRNETVAII